MGLTATDATKPWMVKTSPCPCLLFVNCPHLWQAVSVLVLSTSMMMFSWLSRGCGMILRESMPRGMLKLDIVWWNPVTFYFDKVILAQSRTHFYTAAIPTERKICDRTRSVMGAAYSTLFKIPIEHLVLNFVTVVPSL